MNQMKNLKLVVTAAAFSCMIALSGCASIISGSSQNVSFKSEPPGATLAVDGRDMGKTPVTINLKRKKDQHFTIALDGYNTQEFSLNTGFNPWFLGNIVTGGLLGSTTDSVSGAINEYSPDYYNIMLVPVKASVLSPSAESKAYIIANYKNILEELNTTPGQYTNALLTLLKVAPTKQSEAVSILRELAKYNSDIVDFANRVTASLS